MGIFSWFRRKPRHVPDIPLPNDPRVVAAAESAIAARKPFLGGAYREPIRPIDQRRIVPRHHGGGVEVEVPDVTDVIVAAAAIIASDSSPAVVDVPYQPAPEPVHHTHVDTPAPSSSYDSSPSPSPSFDSSPSPSFDAGSTSSF